MSINFRNIFFGVLICVFFQNSVSAQWEKQKSLFGGGVLAASIVGDSLFLLSKSSLELINHKSDTHIASFSVPDSLLKWLVINKSTKPIMFNFSNGLIMALDSDSLLYFDYKLESFQIIEPPFKKMEQEEYFFHSGLVNWNGKAIMPFFSGRSDENEFTFNIGILNSIEPVSWEVLEVRKSLELSLFPYSGKIKVIEDKAFILGDSISRIDLDKGKISPGLQLIGLPPNKQIENLFWDGQNYLVHIYNPGTLNQNPDDLFLYNGVRWNDIAENAFIISPQSETQFFLNKFFITPNLGIMGIAIKLGTFYVDFEVFLTDDFGETWKQNEISGYVQGSSIVDVIGLSDYCIFLDSELGAYKVDKAKNKVIQYYNVLNNLNGIQILASPNSSDMFVISPNRLYHKNLKTPWGLIDSFNHFKLLGTLNKEYFFIRDGYTFGSNLFRKKAGSNWEEYNTNQKPNGAYKLFGFKNSQYLYQLYYTIYSNALNPNTFKRSNDNGDSWVELFPSLPIDSNEQYSVETDFHFLLVEDVFYFRAKDKVFYSMDFGETWFSCGELGLPKIRDIQLGINEFNENLVIANKLYNFKNIGDYELWAFNENDIKWVLVDTLPLNPMNIQRFDLPSSFSWNSNNIYVSPQKDSNWLPLTNGLPKTRLEITDMNKLGDSLYVSLKGFGVYSMAISDVPGFKKDTIYTSVQLPEFSFSHYPNPVDEILQITLGTTHTGVDIKLLNLQGITLISQSIPGRQTQSTINTQNLQAGVYILQLTQPNGKSHVRKIVVK